MTVTQLASAIGLILTIAGAAFASRAYVESEVEAVRLELAAAEERREQGDKAAFQAAYDAHGVEFWRSEAERQRRRIEYLRASGASPDEIEEALRDLEYYKAEQREALKRFSGR